MGEKVPGTMGMVSVKDLTMDHVSFDVNSVGGNERLDNIQGMKVNYSGPTGGFDGNVKALSIGRAPRRDYPLRSQRHAKLDTCTRSGRTWRVQSNAEAGQQWKSVVTNGQEIETRVRRAMAF